MQSDILDTKAADRTLYAPINLDLKITDECNFRCEMCKMWTIKETEGVLSTERKKSLLREYAELSPNGMVYLTGGEPFKKEEEVFALTTLARELGIPSFMSSNGSYICANNARQIPKRGPRVLQLSLESHLPEVHDRIRGFKGAFLGVMAAIDLININRTPNDKFTLIVNHIIRENNFRQLDEFAEFVKSKGVDRLKFQIIHPTINHNGHEPGQNDRIYDKNQVRSLEEFETAFRALFEKFGTESFLAHNLAEMEWLIEEVKGENLDKHVQCLAFKRNVVVNSWGDVQLCAHTADIWDGSLGKIQGTTLKEAIWGDPSRELREIMKVCTKSCSKFLGREQYFFSWIRSLET